MTPTLAERMHNKANTHKTIDSCSIALDAVRDALEHFEAEHQKSGLFLNYLHQLYNVEMLRRALLEIKSYIDAAEQRTRK